MEKTTAINTVINVAIANMLNLLKDKSFSSEKHTDIIVH